MKKITISLVLLWSATAWSQVPDKPEPGTLNAECGHECIEPRIILNTGYDHSSNSLYPDYSRDEYWKVEQIALPSPNGTPTDYCAYVIPKAPHWDHFDQNVWYVDGDPNAAWISFHPSNLNTVKNMNPSPNCLPTAGAWRFSRTFEVCNGATRIYDLQLAILSHGVITDIYIDNTPLPPAMGPCQFSNFNHPAVVVYWSTFSLTPGVHKISFNMYADHDGRPSIESDDYFGVSIIGSISGNNLYKSICSGKNECLEEEIPMQPCFRNSGDLSVQYLGKEEGTCYFAALASALSVSPWTATQYTWYFDNTLVHSSGAGLSSVYNLSLGSSTEKVLTVKIVYTDGEGNYCVSYHSQRVACSPPESPDRVASLKNLQQPPALSIFPNPSNGDFYLGQIVDEFSVSDIMGKVVARGTMTNIIKGERFAKGIYVVRITNRGTVENHYLIKE